MGARGKIGFLKIFQPIICNADDPISKTNSPPITKSATILPVKSPITEIIAPKERDPASPKKILAGQILKYKKAIKAPIQREIKRDSEVSKLLADMAVNAIKQIIKSPPASPSNPSLILNAFEKPTITKAAKGMYQKPNFKVSSIRGM